MPLGNGPQSPAAPVAVATAVAPAFAEGDSGPLSLDLAGNLRTTAAGGGGATTVQGDVAHDSPDSGNPVKVGQKAVAHGVSPTAVAAGDRTDWYAHRHGIPFVISGHMNAFRAIRKDTAAQTDVVLLAVAAGQIAVVTAVSVYCSNVNTVNVQALVEFDDVADVVIVEHPNIAPGSGFTEGNGGGILAIGADGQDILWTCGVPTSGSVTVHVTGYLIQS